MEVNLQDFSGEYLYSVAAMFSAGAYLLRSTLWLRILLVLAAIVYIITGVSLGITSMIGWNSTYLMINLAHIVVLMLDRVTINLPPETRKIYRHYFSTMSTREFKKLIMMNDFKVYKDQYIATEQSDTDRLYIILSGEVKMTRRKKTIAVLRRGDFIGEMSFLTNEHATADAYAENYVQCAFWTHGNLEKLKLRNKETYNKFIAIIGRDLVRKLNSQYDAHIELATRLDYVT